MIYANFVELPCIQFSFFFTSNYADNKDTGDNNEIIATNVFLYSQGYDDGTNNNDNNDDKLNVMTMLIIMMTKIMVVMVII